MRLLLVDDEEISVALTRRMLREGDFELDVAASSAEALERLKGPAYDVLLLDYRLGEEDGLDLLRRFRAQGIPTPVIFLTAYGDEEVAASVIKAGAADYLDKTKLSYASLRRAVRYAAEIGNKEKAQREAAERLARSELRYRLVAQATGDAVWDWDLTTGRLEWNNGVRSLFGYDLAEMRQEIGWWEERIHPDDRERIVSGVHAAVGRGDLSWKAEYLFRHRDGSYRRVLDRAAMLRDEGGQAVRMVGVMSDITEAHRNAEALRESETRFRQLAECIREVFWMTDPAKSQILYISPAYKEIWGRPCESLYEDARNWLEAILPEDRRRVLEAALQKQVTGAYDEEYRIVRPDGSLRWIHDRAFPIRDGDGRVYRVVGIAEDVTERRNTQQALRRSQEQLHQAQKMEATGRLAGGVAHELNNPLSVILGFAQRVKSRLKPGDTLWEPLEHIERETIRCRELVKDLLTFSRHSASDGDLKTDVGPAIDQALSLVSAQGRIRNIQLLRDLAPGLPPVLADKNKFQQVLINLCNNAIDAMPDGGRLTVRARRESRDGAPFLVMEVEDTGVGIPPEARSRIFEPFYTTKEVGQGTGLGLSLIYEIVKKYGGEVTFDSRVGKGTVFRVSLPVEG